jgi:hypothetical protein
MSVATMFANADPLYIQDVEAKVQKVKEENAPGFNTFRNNVQKSKHGEKGLKLNYENMTTGGHSTPTATNPDWNEPVAEEYLSSYVYPVRYRLPMIVDWAIIRDFKINKTNASANVLKNKLMLTTEAALKRLERAFYGTGDGALGYSLSALSVGNAQTLNGDTTPAASAGHTKGTSWLRKNNFYHAINTSTGLPRGVFMVTVEGKTSCTVNVISGTIASGDPFVDLNTYQGYFRGLAFLISNTSRTIQAINTADNPDFNSFGVDLAGAPLTFATVEDLMTGLTIRNNDGNKKTGKVFFLPIGQASVLRKSAQNLRVYQNGSNVVKGIAEDVDFGNNLNVIMPADLDDDRGYAAAYDEFGMLEDYPLNDIDDDGQEWRMILGANNSGSERRQRGIGWDGNLYRRGNAMSSAFFKRASVTNVLTQASI